MKVKWKMTCNECNHRWITDIEKYNLSKIKCPKCKKNNSINARAGNMSVDMVTRK